MKGKDQFGKKLSRDFAPEGQNLLPKFEDLYKMRVEKDDSNYEPEIVDGIPKTKKKEID